MSAAHVYKRCPVVWCMDVMYQRKLEFNLSHKTHEEGHSVFKGERKRKILCSRESDRVVVSDQRCHGTARPAAITEPCNVECELRWVSPNVSTKVPFLTW